MHLTHAVNRLLLAAMVLPALACRVASPGSLAPAAATPGTHPPAEPTALPAPTETASAAPATLASTTAIPAEPAPVLTRFFIDSVKHPLAVCNDGTPPVFYYRRGTGNGADKWVLWFKGGGACYDRASCAGRERDLLSSSAWTRTEIRNEGILSSRPSQNPDFYNWNHVFMVYCTSDVWAGARSEQDPETGFYFRGHYVVNAMVDALMDEAIIGQPTLAAASQVLLTGSSAGANGLRHNADRLKDWLAWADVRAACDAALTFIVNPEFADVAETIALEQYAAWQPQLDVSCVAANAAQPWACGDSVFLVQGGHIETPLFLRHDLFDPLSLGNQSLDPKNTQDRPMIESFARQVAGLLEQQSGAFGTRARQHVMIETEGFNGYQVDGFTFADVLGNWYFDRDGPKVIVERAEP